MSISFSSRLNHCASCSHWGGSRESVGSGTTVRVKKENDEGICGNSKSVFKKKSTRANYSSCTKYEKWSILK